MKFMSSSSISPIKSKMKMSWMIIPLNMSYSHRSRMGFSQDRVKRIAHISELVYYPFICFMDNTQCSHYRSEIQTIHAMWGWSSVFMLHLIESLHLGGGTVLYGTVRYGVQPSVEQNLDSWVAARITYSTLVVSAGAYIITYTQVKH